jgi:hypothetical protein
MKDPEVAKGTLSPARRRRAIERVTDLLSVSERWDISSVLDEQTTIRGAPAHLRADNGPELVSKAVKA